MRPLAALADIWRRGHWLETAPYRAARLAGLPLWSYREKETAAYIDGAFIHTLTGNWVRVEEVSPGRFRQRCSAPPPLRFGLGLLPAPLMAATNFPTISIGTNDDTIYATNADYATAHNAASGTLAGVGSTGQYVGQAVDYRIYRAFEPVDATGLPDTCNLVSGDHRFFVLTDNSTTDFNVTLVGFTGSNPCVAGDYDLFGTTSFGSVTTAGISLVAYTTLTLNAAGLAAISKTAVTLLGLRSSRDISSTTPTQLEYLAIGSANHGTPGYRPVLDLIYTHAITVGRDLDIRYGIQIFVGRDLEVRYAAGAVIGRDLEVRYAAGAVIGRDLEVRYAAGAVIGRDLEIVYGVSPHFRFVGTPAWEAQVGPRPNRVRVLIEGTTTVKTAGTPAASSAIDGPPISVAADTTAVQAQAVADARLAAYEQDPLRIAGPVCLNALVDFGSLLPLYWYEQAWSGAVRTYPLRETASLPVTAIEHDVDGGATRFEAGDPVPSDEQIIADALNKLK